MITVNILYPNKKGARFDLDYYVNIHMPMSIKLLEPTLRRVIVEHGLSNAEDESPPPFIGMCHLSFDSVDAFLAAFLPHADALRADMNNYTDIEPIIQFSEPQVVKSSTS